MSVQETESSVIHCGIHLYTTILRSTQAKISRRLSMMREVDLDPISIVILIIPLLNLKI